MLGIRSRFSVNSAISRRVSHQASFFGSLLRGLGLRSGGPSCWGSCVVCHCCLRVACILASSGHHCPLPCANWAEGIDKQFVSQGMASPFVSSGIGTLDSRGLLSKMAQGRQRVWEGLHVSPRTAPSEGAKLCTYHHWFGRPDKVRCEPYYCQWVLPGSGHWCNSGLVRMLCLWSRAGMPGLPSLITFACAIFVAPRCWR